MALKRTTIIFLIIAAGVFILVLSLSTFSFLQMFPGKLVRVQSGSMHNPEPDSIETGDLLKIKDVDRESDITTYVQGLNEGYRKAGSYGDVMVFRSNGEYDRTPILHRAVIWIEFNSTTYDEETGLGGGYDVPSLDLKNVMTKFTIENYEWPSRPGGGEEDVNVATILYKFRTNGLEPHSGFLTKGDDNDDVDQTATFGGAEPLWIQPVEMRWVIGIYRSHVERDPLNISCCISWLVLPAVLGVGILLLVLDIREAIKKRNAPRRPHRRRDMRTRAPPPKRSRRVSHRSRDSRR